jgi:hypothetical protein
VDPSSSVQVYLLPVIFSSSLRRTRGLQFLHQPRIC